MNSFTPEEFAVHLRAQSEALEGNLIDAEAENLSDAAREAHALSAGPFSTRQLRRMGHPYARRDPHPPDDAAIINRQGGDFDDGWHEIAPEARGDSIVAELPNDSREAAFMDGTDRMINRPIVQRIAQRVTNRRVRRVGDALIRTFTGE